MKDSLMSNITKKNEEIILSIIGMSALLYSSSIVWLNSKTKQTIALWFLMILTSSFVLLVPKKSLFLVLFYLHIVICCKSWLSCLFLYIFTHPCITSLRQHIGAKEYFIGIEAKIYWPGNSLLKILSCKVIRISLCTYFVSKIICMNFFVWQ